MNNRLIKKGRKLALTQILFTMIIIVLLTICFYIYWDFNYAKSALIGGLVAVLPNIAFAYKAFKYAGAQSSKKVIDSFFSGVKLKMVLTALLFALAFKFLVLLPVPFFVMFCVVMVVPLIAPVFLKSHYK